MKPVFDVEKMVFDIRKHPARNIQGFLESLTVIVIGKQRQIFFDDAVPLGNQFFSRAARIFARFEGIDVHFDTGQGNIEIVVPGFVMMEPAGPG